MKYMLINCVLIVIVLAGCNLLRQPLPSDDSTPRSPAATALVTPSRPWTDARDVMSGICFEAALDAADQVFIIRDDDQLNNFFDLADNSGLCRRAIERGSFDFSNEAVLIGLWSAGRGCVADHEILDYQRDDATMQITMRIVPIMRGDCDYELVRPFWIGLDAAADYDITLLVEPVNLTSNPSP